MADEDDINRTLGALDARVTTLERQVQAGQVETRTMLSVLSAKLDTLAEQVAESRGVKQTLAWAIGFIGALAALASATHFLSVLH